MATAQYLQAESRLTAYVRRWNRRLRWVESLTWGPRAVIVALLIGIGIAGASRMVSWFLPAQIAGITAGVAGVTLLATMGLIWLLPRPTARSARHFDQRFLLNERVSTALEISSGRLDVPEPIMSLQLSDAVAAADGVDTRRYLPARVRRWEIVGLLVLLVILVTMLLLHNPQTEALEARRELAQAIAQQSASLDELIEEIEQNDDLTPAEKDALIQPLEEAREILSQPDVTQQEAVAAMASAQQSLEETSNGMLSDQRDAYRDAAQELAGSDLTMDMAQALDEPDLGAAAEAAQDVAQELAEGELSQAERDALANRLEAAAQALEANNPALAEKLQEAADALRAGDEEAAQQALQGASETLEAQEDQLARSELAEASQSAQDTLSDGQQELAQAGQEPSSSSDDQQSGGQQSQQLPEAGEESSQSAGTGQSGEDEEPGEEGADPAQEQSPQQGQPQGAADDSAEISPQGAGTSAEDSPAAGQESADGQSESSASGEGQSSAEGGTVAEGTGQDGSNAPASGTGEGGAGVDVVEGAPQDAGQGEISAGNTAGTTGGNPQPYESDNAPTVIGGESDITLDVGGASQDQQGEVVQQGELGPNPAGQSSLTYTDVYGNYQDAISDALESGRIPLDQRDVIHDYFSSLEP